MENIWNWVRSKKYLEWFLMNVLILFICLYIFDGAKQIYKNPNSMNRFISFLFGVNLMYIFSRMKFKIVEMSKRKAIVVLIISLIVIFIISTLMYKFKTISFSDPRINDSRYGNTTYFIVKAAFSLFMPLTIGRYMPSVLYALKKK